MTSSIPNSFSADDLQRLMDNAVSEPEAKEPQDPRDIELYDGHTQRSIEERVEEMINNLGTDIRGPIAHKVAMISICRSMFEWHNTMGQKHMEEGELQSAECWLRDAGHFQVIHNILTNISVGNEDFTCSDYDPDRLDEEDDDE